MVCMYKVYDECGRIYDKFYVNIVINKFILYLGDNKILE